VSETQKTKNPRKTNASAPEFDELSELKKKYEKEMQEMKKQIEALSGSSVSVNTEKTEKESIDLDDDIDVISLCNGVLNLTTGGFGKGELYSFNEFGQVLPIPYRDLKEIAKNNRSFLEKGYFYIDNQKARVALRISKLYEKMPVAQDLITMLDKDSVTIKKTLSIMTPEQKTMIASLVIDKLFNGEKLDMNLVKEIGDSVDKDLSTIARDKRELVSVGEE